MTRQIKRNDAASEGLRTAMLVFERWVDATTDERTSLLEDVAQRDPEAHRCLLRLIEADGVAESIHFLDRGAADDARRSMDGTEPEPQPLQGERIGAWRLRELLGAGGSGQVWLAQRCDGSYEGLAALKLLRAPAIDTHAQKRFAREGRLLARLRHAHIARLFDAGEGELRERAQRFIVLEYIDGERIDDWCDRKHATIETRLRLFLQVCDAVSYAHANLIVHRDLKPSNILVQADGAAKLLDFGIAKLLAAEDADAEVTELTQAGIAPFTPEYAAPEQFEGKPATVATDVYSLGIVLYVLLAGRRPYETDATPRQLARNVLDGASRRLAHALERTEDTGRVALHRGTTPQVLRRLLRGDLDTILGTALKRDPSERYASVQALADDVRRFLDHKPIRARADSALYRTRMFVRRHRGSVAIGCVTLLSLLLGSGTLLVQDYRLQAEIKRANAIKQFLLDAISSVDPYFSDGRPVLDPLALLKYTSEAIDRELPEDYATRAELYERLGKLTARLSRFADAEQLDRKAAGTYRQMEGEHSLHAFDAEINAIAKVLDRGEVEPARNQMADLLTRVAAIPNLPDARRTRLKALLLMAFNADQVGNLLLARDWAQRAAGELRPDIEAESGYYANARRRLAVIALQSGAVREAAPLLLELARLGLVSREPDPQRAGLYLHYLVWALFEQGNYLDAKPIADAAIAMMHRQGRERADEIVQLYADRAEVEWGLGGDAAAERDFAAALKYAGDLFKYKRNDRAQLALYYGYGIYLLEHGRFEEAMPLFASCQRVVSEVPNNWHNVRAACAAGSAYAAAHGGAAAAQIAELDRLIGEMRAHAARDLPRVLWLRAQLAAEHIANDTPSGQLDWLDEAGVLLDRSGRGGSLLARRIAESRVTLGAAPATLHADPDDQLVEVANAVLAASP